jgi:hypothetical protein
MGMNIAAPPDSGLSHTMSSRTAPPVLLLTTNLGYGCGLANALLGQGVPVRQIVLEGGVPALHRGARSRLFDALGLNPWLWLARHRRARDERWLDLLEKGCRRAADLRFARGVGGRCYRWPADVPLCRCERINGMDPAFFERHADCLFLVFLTTILRPHVFDASRLATLNWHPALLPCYRGTHPEFWQLYHNERDQFGYTLHRIDRQVDTGPILFQRPIAYEGWNPWELRTLSLLDFLPRLPSLLADFAAGRLEERPQPPCSMPTYRNRDLLPARRMEYFTRHFG